MEFYLFAVSLTIWLIGFPHLSVQGGPSTPSPPSPPSPPTATSPPILTSPPTATSPPSEGGVCSPRHGVPRDHINQYFYVELDEWLVTNTLTECAMGCVYMTACRAIFYDIHGKSCVRFRDVKTETTIRDEDPYTVYLEMADFIEVLGPTGNPCLSKPCDYEAKCVPHKTSYVCENDYNEYKHCAHAYMMNVEIFTTDPVGKIGASSLGEGSSTEYLSFVTRLSPGWTPASNDHNPYIAVRFDGDFLIKGILTRGNPPDNSWVTSYTVHRTSHPHCSSLTPVLDSVTGLTKIFEGNTEPFKSKLNFFDEPFYAGCIRVMPDPLSVIKISTKLDVLGCPNRKLCTCNEL